MEFDHNHRNEPGTEDIQFRVDSDTGNIILTKPVHCKNTFEFEELLDSRIGSGNITVDTQQQKIGALGWWALMRTQQAVKKDNPGNEIFLANLSEHSSNRLDTMMLGKFFRRIKG